MNSSPDPDATPNRRTRYERRETAAADALRGLLRETLLEKFPSLAAAPAELELNVSFRLDTAEAGGLVFEPNLRQQVVAQATESLAARTAYREGAVYDFGARSSETPLCRPPDATSVFAGYDGTGRPLWSARDVDRIEPTTTRGRDLRKPPPGLRGAERAYSVLGQVEYGPVPLPASYRELAGGERLAMTFQAVETRDPQGQFRLRLNPLAGRLLPDEWERLLEERELKRVATAFVKARERLAEVEREAFQALAHRDSNGYRETMRRVPGVLHGLAGDLKRATGTSRSGAEEPSAGEVLEAGIEDLFYDANRRTWVVVARGSGTGYVFSESGDYLTRFQADPEKVARRLGAERWRPAGAADEAFLMRVKARLRGDEAPR